MSKVYPSAKEALFDLDDGATIMASGFGLCGNPENLIEAIRHRGTKALTVVSNNCGTNEYGLSILLRNKQIKKMISSYVGENKEFERQFLHGELEVELNPQGTLAERIRAAGAGIPAFFTPTGIGTQVSEGGLPMEYDAEGNVTKSSPKKETRQFGKKTYVMETALHADFAIVKAQRADTFGNLLFNKTARNFGPMMCQAAKTTIVEVEEIVEAGQIDPDHVHLPGIFVDRVVQGQNYQKWIEFRTTRPREA